ncbi:MAG: hypothetical protein PHI03_12565 [Bacteroidales bacterium]|nr:hypothetical protein [Bacteroidales bacterium]
MQKSLNSQEQRYFNIAQLDANAVNAHDERIIASRGVGKSEGIDSSKVARNALYMPRSMNALLTPTYAKLLQNTLPAVGLGLERMGYKRDIHWVVGRKPEKKLGFKEPYTKGFDYSNSMTWFNGSVFKFISFETKMSSNSMSLDSVIGFEAKYLKYDKIINEVSQANRGRNPHFENCPYHHSTYYSSDMPTSKGGMWLIEEEKKMTHDLIDAIKSRIADLVYFMKKRSTSYTERQIAECRKDINRWRSKAFYFKEYNIFDNLELITPERIAEFKRDLPPLIFRTSILNQRIFKQPNGFYSALDEDAHFYVDDNSSYFLNLEYDLQKAASETCLADADLSEDLPLCIAFDYNSAISSMSIGQTPFNVYGQELRTVNSMFVKTPDKLQDLVKKFCKYYSPRINRDVVYYYDSTAIHTYANTSESFADLIIRILRDHGFNVIDVYIGNPMPHQSKHLYIDMALKGAKYMFPSFNLHRNEYLKLAMEQAGVKVGRNGFEKDKSMEKLEDSPEFPDEQKTHITDSWDTLFIGCNFYPYNGADVQPPASWNN